MSNFFYQDLVALKEDRSIKGHILYTWSDLETETGVTGICYVHKSLPARVTKAWFLELHLLPGYVVVEFMQEEDGFLLIAESSLCLLDRSLAVGDLVKRKSSDSQSGTVISTSLQCTLKPICTLEEFTTPNQNPAQSYTPSHGPHSNKSKSSIHGFPRIDGHSQSLDRPSGPRQFEASASDLRHWNDFQEDDLIIYREWLGQVKSLVEEITLRLSNGSVVTVETSEELQEPLFVLGTSSYELAQRLDRSGFYQYRPLKYSGDANRLWSFLARARCYPGQILETKKANLRRGQWKFGAYDPNVQPRGMVVHVRCVQMEVEWLCPNLFNPNREQAEEPPSFLGTDALDYGEVRVYDKSTPLKTSIASRLPDATYSPDTSFGCLVRFKDSTGAALKYGRWSQICRLQGEEDSAQPTNHDCPPPPGDPESSELPHTPTANLSFFEPIPRASTQGYDMNVLQIMQKRTKTLVRWQDYSLTEETAVSLVPLLSPDEQEVWPGDRVSYQPDEEHHVEGVGVEIVRVKKVGIVQSVNAVERIARVRWYENTSFDLVVDGKAWEIVRATLGTLSNEEDDVSLYEIIAYPSLNFRPGDEVIVLPKELRGLSQADYQLSTRYQDTGEFMAGAFRAMRRITSVVLGGDTSSNTNISNSEIIQWTDQHEQQTQNMNDHGAQPLGTTCRPENETQKEVIKWFGEIADTCLDGHVIVKLGGLSNPCEVKLPMERVVAFTSDSLYDSDDPDDDSEYSDYGYDSTWDSSDPDAVDAMDVNIEYEGGRNLDADGDEDTWTTEDEEGPPQSRRSDHDKPSTHVHDSAALIPMANNSTTKTESENLAGQSQETLSFGNYPAMPPPFLVLESPPPQSLYYFDRFTPLTSAILRRIGKEHKILQSSLPDGVFVRTWDTRLDLLRILIIGPSGTPYEHAPFVIDLQLSSPYPSSPPASFFHSWTNGHGRINPNLYQEGKICLSLLGTWHADVKNEGWSEKTSTILQIIVSIMGLVLVKDPYYNEAGFDILKGSAESQVPSILYNEKVYVMSKTFIRVALTNHLEGLDEIIRWLYTDASGPHLLRQVVKDCSHLLPDKQSENATVEKSPKGNQESSSGQKLSAGALILLRKDLEWLKERLGRTSDGASG